MTANILSNDRMIYTGEKPWHNLGVEIGPDESIEAWSTRAFPWHYQSKQTYLEIGDAIDGYQAIVRSDTGEVLNIVTDRFQIVQPQEIMGFFQSMIDEKLYTMETAGSLRNGRRIWALAKYNGDPISLFGQDIVQPYCLLATSVDGSFATTAQLSSIRTVCENTLSLSLGDSGATTVKVPHIAAFNPDSVKAQLGFAESAVHAFEHQLDALCQHRISDIEAIKFLHSLVGDAKKPLEDQPRSFGKIVDLFQRGKGQNLRSARNTLWGVINAVTEYADHHATQRTTGGRLNSAWFGANANLKKQVYDAAINLAFDIKEAA